MASSFPQQVFLADQPAQLKQGDWLSDTEFLDLLEDSWRSQYADYIGEQQANEYLDMLRREGHLYDHNDPLTIHAWINGRIVGVTSLRPLQGVSLITMLEVHPQYRGRGIGTQLVEALCCASQRIVAHVSIHQPRTKQFYSRLGFHLLQRTHVQHGSHNLEFEVMAMSTKQQQDSE